MKKMSVAEAKRICKARYNKLPSVGYEMEVRHEKNGNKTYLVNTSGKFSVRVYESVNSRPLF